MGSSSKAQTDRPIALSLGPANDVNWAQSISDPTELVMPPGTPPSESNSKPTDATVGSSDISTYEVIPSTLTNNESANKSRLPCYLLKSQVKNPTFLGRTDVLERLEKVLLPEKKTTLVEHHGPAGPKIFALCGMGGVGKTQVAVEFALSHKKKLDAIFWLHADDTTKLAKDFGDISLALGLEKASTDQAVSKDLVLEWLSRAQEQCDLDKGNESILNWLLIFDNADDLGVVVDYLPVSGSGSILITSRDPKAMTQTRFQTTDGIDLDPFSKDDAGKLLRTLTGYEGGETDVKLSQEIAEKLHGLPLAVTQIAGTVTLRDLSLQEFLELFDKDSDRLEIYKSVDAGIVAEGGRQMTVFSIWAFEDLSPAGTSLLDLLSGLDPDRVQEGYPNTALAFVDTRTELARSSLIKRNITRKELSMHRLIQDSVRTRMNQERLQKVFQILVDLVSFSWPFGSFNHSTTRHPLCEAIFPHIRSLQLWYEGSDRLKESNIDYQKFARLLMDAGWYQIERGNPRDSLPLSTLSEHLCNLDLQNHETRAILALVHFCNSEVGLLTNDSGIILDHAEKGMEVLQSIGDKSWRIIVLNNNLSLSNITIGQWDTAIHYADEAIAVCLALNDPEHYPYFPIISKGYALMFKGTAESLELAAEILSASLEHIKETAGEKELSMRTGLTLLVLGRVRGSQGRWDESLDLHQRTLQHYLGSIGPSHHRTAAAYVIVSEHYVRLDRLSEARDMLENALKILGTRPIYSAQIARICFRLARVQSSLGQAELAHDSKERATALMEDLSKSHGRKLGEEDVDDLLAFWSK